MLKRKKRKKKLSFLAFEPTPLSFNVLDTDSSLFEYTSSGDNALEVCFLKTGARGCERYHVITTVIHEHSQSSFQFCSVGLLFFSIGRKKNHCLVHILSFWVKILNINKANTMFTYLNFNLSLAPTNSLCLSVSVYPSVCFTCDFNKHKCSGIFS
jgi:hypothetical protein